MSKDISEQDLSRAVVRIAVATAALWAMSQYTLADYASFLAIYSANEYRPKGWVLAWLCPEIPSVAFLGVVKVVGFAATIMALVGFLSRWSMLVSAVCGMVLVGILFSFRTGNCHGYNAILMTQLALLPMQPSRFLSVDGRLKLTTRRTSAGDLWLAQFAVAAMFASAALQKLKADDFQFGWISGQNLRTHFFMRYPVLGEEIPGYLLAVVNSEAMCTWLAALNVASQTLPLVACFLFRWPRLRLMFGVFFLLEVIGLGVLMNLWDLHLLPLGLVFVDWEYFSRLVTGRDRKVPLEVASWRKTRFAFAAGFVCLCLAIALSPDQHVENNLNTFPFSNFGMYSDVRAAGPFDYNATEFEIDAPSIPGDKRVQTQRALQRQFPEIAQEAFSFDQISRHLVTTSRIVQGWSADWVRIYVSRYQMPPFPEPFQVKVLDRTILGAMNPRTKTIYAAQGTFRREGERRVLDVETTGYQDPEFSVSWAESYGAPKQMVPSETVANYVYFPMVPNGSLVFLTVLDGPSKQSFEHLMGEAK